ncbi:MAG: Smr/MutS family protein [Pseudotabrizicola sp.]|uniref:Smr/MutS family protein n=1 Tax=Pseudotabrizicola sp. TaxID=2939647 RepID=UPI00271C19E6|nr:Smr/MutS family protein [Pseudotabrizicola sp.]MDO8882604.1 Smr/MutS family protein [Pseudotabrizicola sp.]MDP2083415.1 Smr/MutS family protein [Pseudotabrizicola sp.]MDZ7574953.1 Smr/MutS family protein [Pseudotabrizicola sp.]
MARRRTLRPDEVDLWHAVARTARAMHSNGTKILHGSAEAPKRQTTPPSKHDAATPLPKFRLGERAKSAMSQHVAPSLPASLTGAALQMDAKAFGRMTRGKLVPEARIDLHGLTLAEAHPDLTRFILNAHGQGLRLVLVITGKGKAKPDHGPIPSRIGVLRHHVPQWLRLPPLGPLVLQVTESHVRHGGTGAYYVYLRRGR